MGVRRAHDLLPIREPDERYGSRVETRERPFDPHHRIGLWTHRVGTGGANRPSKNIEVIGAYFVAIKVS